MVWFSMSYITQLNPSIPVDTPKGKGEAVLIVDYGPEHNLLWVVFLDSGGECWTFDNTLIRGCINESVGRKKLDMNKILYSDEILDSTKKARELLIEKYGKVCKKWGFYE